ncbi:Rossmann-like and DUF2520 domain-containing protein [Sphingobium cupriresistens]|uniref:Cytoplasmic protein n=1 Tax=Sphingobium cupriresistens LL01 TaxID=1420583 RepID=A0A0J7XN89_9SPHN|nr:DUF2520 domain-containing protein [Sphingobium cupriresistens]KMS53094.1 hypothetical protein V473_19095 [Sphingobium cupriresistens LL01]
MRNDPPYRRIGIIGTGRVAQAMALALHAQAADPLLVWGRDPARRDAMVARIGHAQAAHDLTAIASTCDLILIAVSDDAIPDLVAALAQQLPASATPFILHLSGRSGAAVLAPLAQRGALTAAVHPAMTFTGDPLQEVARMVGARFVVTADTQAAIAAAQALVALLGGGMEQVAEAQRALYHAALCHAANHLVTLIAGARDALAAAGVAEPGALLRPLVRAALDNSLDRGMAALSGPLLRGDGDTIADHLAALSTTSPHLLPAYRAMAIATLDALERSGPQPAAGLREALASIA